MTLGTLAEQSVEVRLERTAGLELGVLACLLMTSHGTDLCPRSQCDSRSPSLGAVPSDITLSPQDCLCLAFQACLTFSFQEIFLSPHFQCRGLHSATVAKAVADASTKDRRLSS